VLIWCIWKVVIADFFIPMVMTDPDSGAPVALTMAMLRPEVFRIVIEATKADVSADRIGSLASAWTHAGDGWDP
jgi:hypothetical protein